MSLVMALALAAAAAAADDDAGSPIEKAHRLAACLVRASSGEVRSLVAMSHLHPQYGARLTQLVNGRGQGCKKKAKGLSVGMNMLNGVLAEALLRARFQPDVPVEQLARDPSRPVRTQNAAEALALCTVYGAPRVSSRLLASSPGSTAESRAFDMLRPALASCSSQGARVTEGSPALRAVLAVAAWRIVAAERVQ